MQFKPWLDICRVSNLPTVWTNVLAALAVSGGAWSTGEYLVIAASMSLFYTGGMCLNDIFDADLDAGYKPFRPIPSGRIAMRSAVRFTTGLFIAALLLLLVASDLSGVPAGIALLSLIIAYDRFHKGRPVTVLLMAGCRLMVFVTAGYAAFGGMEKAVWIAGAAQFVYIVVLSAVAVLEKRLPGGFGFPLIPYMIAGISLIDAALIAALAPSPGIMPLVAASGAALTIAGQRFVRGD
ncbi:MAG: UbiA family prenyltransferase [Nitrospirae bacterium]|nr:UbiA family prenyltransferase [Nitrospirota bacterium]